MLALRTQPPRLRHRVRPNLELLEDRTVPTMLGQELYPADNPWNQYIADAPVAANSSAVMNNIIKTYGDKNLHPDFGEQFGDHRSLYGIPYNIVHGNTAPKVNVVIDAYGSESDIVPVPMPANPVLENDWQDGPRVGVGNRGDSHLLIWDVDNNIAYELYRVSRPSETADGKWHAYQQTVWDMKTNDFRPLGWTSADAAGLSILAGLARPAEALPVSQGGQGVIKHAIRMTLENAVILNEFIYPASHTANPGNTNEAIQPPMGARFRLKASVDISYLSPQSRIVAQAMKDYGLIVADNGSNFFISGASYDVNHNNQVTLTWDNDDIQSRTTGLKSLNFSDFELVDLTPRVTQVSGVVGQPGSEVTIVGQNFSGSAGHLTVWFGTTAATSVTYVSDSQLKAIVPQGSGTVDVRVQSGVATTHSRNYTGNIFGYGISAAHANARFTYGTPSGNAAPTVAQAAQATALTTSVDLTVLGADDAGEAGLTYTWSVLSKPSGAVDPVFSLNGTNAAKATAATLSQAGSYAFRVSIRDAEGLTVSSDVTVSVKQIVTSITVAPDVVTVFTSSKTRFTASAFDQFGNLLAEPPTFAWRLRGAGKLSSTGKYTAPAKPGGPYVIVARFGAVRGLAVVTVVRP